VHRQPLSVHVPCVTRDSEVEVVCRSLRIRDECVKMLQFHLSRAQNRMKSQANKHRTDVDFQVGDLF